MPLLSHKPILTFRFFNKIEWHIWLSFSLVKLILIDFYIKRIKCWANLNTNDNLLFTRLVLQIPSELFWFFTKNYITICISILLIPDFHTFSTDYCKVPSIKPIILFQFLLAIYLKFNFDIYLFIHISIYILNYNRSQN